MNKTILSNSCVGSLLYTYSNVPHLTPLIGSLFLDDLMYIEFLENYDYYVNLIPEYVENYDRDLKLKGHLAISNKYVLMKLDNIEIHWIHENSINSVNEKWIRRLDRSLNKERILIWTSSEFMQYHDDIERKELIERFCNLPEYTIFLTERKEEEGYYKNYSIIFIQQWENKLQNDRFEWGFLKWNNQVIQANKILEFLKNKI